MTPERGGVARIVGRGVLVCVDGSHDVRLARIAETQHGVFDRRTLDSLGMSRSERAVRLASGRWDQPYEGVYRLSGAPITWRSQLLAAVLAGGPLAVAARRSGASVWDLPGGDRSIQELLCPRWRRARHSGLVVHESKVLAPGDRTVVGGIPVTTIERTLLDLGAVRSPDTAERAVEDALRRGLTTLDTLDATVRRLGRRGRNGAGVLRAILEARTVDRHLTESDMELRLLQVLRRNGLPEPVVQHEVWHGGRFVARVDAAYVEWKIALEYESYAFHTGNAALVRDSARRNALVAIDWKPISVTWPDLVSGGAQVCADIRRAAHR